jgi:hypothetical protein
LGDVRGGGGRLDLPQGSGIDEVRVTRDDFAEGGFITVPGEGGKQLGVGLFLHLI